MSHNLEFYYTEDLKIKLQKVGGGIATDEDADPPVQSVSWGEAKDVFRQCGVEFGCNRNVRGRGGVAVWQGEFDAEGKKIWHLVPEATDHPGSKKLAKMMNQPSSAPGEVILQSWFIEGVTGLCMDADCTHCILWREERGIPQPAQVEAMHIDLTQGTRRLSGRKKTSTKRR